MKEIGEFLKIWTDLRFEYPISSPLWMRLALLIGLSAFSCEFWGGGKSKVQATELRESSIEQEEFSHPLEPPILGTSQVNKRTATGANHPNLAVPETDVTEVSKVLNTPLSKELIEIPPKASRKFSIDAALQLDNFSPSLTPSKIKTRQGRHLIQGLRNISKDLRSLPGFYEDRHNPLVQQRLAWQRRKTLASPKGKPTHGFVFISSLFGKRRNPFGNGTEFHNGIDLVGAKGTPILATASGRVKSRGRGRGYGVHVVLDHGFGYETLYAHLSRKRVRPNQVIKRGQVIGYLGNSGRSTGPHLHYSVYFNRVAVDPRPFMFR